MKNISRKNKIDNTESIESLSEIPKTTINNNTSEKTNIKDDKIKHIDKPNNSNNSKKYDKTKNKNEKPNKNIYAEATDIVIKKELFYMLNPENYYNRHKPVIYIYILFLII